MQKKEKEGKKYVETITDLLKHLNWWAFTGCLEWPAGMPWRARNRVTNFMCLMLFRHITRPMYDWIRR